jgi:hypothetical protein
LLLSIWACDPFTACSTLAFFAQELVERIGFSRLALLPHKTSSRHNSPPCPILKEITRNDWRISTR